MKFDMLSLGPARMDCFVTLPDEDIAEVCSIDKKKCVIELGFGDKIPVRAMEFAVGGNTANNAVGLRRLGLRTAMAGTMGADWVDQRAIDVLKQESVDMTHIVQESGKFGFGAIINYQGERTILSYYPESGADYTLQGRNLDASWIYLTTVGKTFEAFYKDAVLWAKEHGAKIGFNPGSRQLRAGVEALIYVLEITEVLFVNREEAEVLLQMPSRTDVKLMLAELKKLGPRVVVITDGPAGACSFDGQEYLYMDVIKSAPVVERTGAGDAFGSGFLAAYMQGKSVREALLWGMCNSGSVLGYVGPQKGLLTSEQMNSWVEKNRDLAAVVL